MADVALICALCGEEIVASRKTIEVDTTPPTAMVWHWPRCLRDEVVGALVNSQTRAERAALVDVVRARGAGRVRRTA